MGKGWVGLGGWVRTASWRVMPPHARRHKQIDTDDNQAHKPTPGIITLACFLLLHPKTYILVALQGQIPLGHGALHGRVHLVVGTVADRDGKALGGHVQGKVLALLYDRQRGMNERVCACVPRTSSCTQVMLICPTPHSFKTYHDGQTVQTHVSHGFGLEGGGASNACGVDVGGFVVSGVRTRRGRLHSRGRVCWVSCSSPSPGLRNPAPWGAEESGGVLVVPVALCLPVCVCLCV